MVVVVGSGVVEEEDEEKSEEKSIVVGSVWFGLARLWMQVGGRSCRGWDCRVDC